MDSMLIYIHNYECPEYNASRRPKLKKLEIAMKGARLRRLKLIQSP